MDTQIHEVISRCSKREKTLYLKYYITAEERKELIAALGDAACMLYEYYLRMASIPDKTMEDYEAAEYFGWSTKKVQRNRLALVGAGWFRASRFTHSDGRKGIAYYVGQDAVQKSYGE